MLSLISYNMFCYYCYYYIAVNSCAYTAHDAENIFQLSACHWSKILKQPHFA